MSLNVDGLTATLLQVTQHVAEAMGQEAERRLMRVGLEPICKQTCSTL